MQCRLCPCPCPCMPVLVPMLVPMPYPCPCPGPCRSVLSHAMPCHAVPCRAMPCHAVPWRGHAVPCRAMPRLCRATWSPITLYRNIESLSLFSMTISMKLPMQSGSSSSLVNPRWQTHLPVGRIAACWVLLVGILALHVRRTWRFFRITSILNIWKVENIWRGLESVADPNVGKIKMINNCDQMNNTLFCNFMYFGSTIDKANSVMQLIVAIFQFNTSYPGCLKQVLATMSNLKKIILGIKLGLGTGLGLGFGLFYF